MSAFDQLESPKPSEEVREKGRLMVATLAAVAVVNAVVAFLYAVGITEIDAEVIAGINAGVVAAAAALEKGFTEIARGKVYAKETVEHLLILREIATNQGPPEDGEAEYERVSEPWPDRTDVNVLEEDE